MRARILSYGIVLVLGFLAVAACSRGLIPTDVALPPSATLPATATVIPTHTDTPLPTATAITTAVPSPISTETSTPTKTPTNTATPEPTPTPEFSGGFRIENLVFTDFRNPEAATWALVFRPDSQLNPTQLEGKTIKIAINGTLLSLSGADALAQVQTYGGILIDYVESTYDSEDLLVDIQVRHMDQSLVYDHPDESVPNWAHNGVIQMPTNCNTSQSILDDPNIHVYHFDDLDPSNGLKTSFAGVSNATYTQDGRWIPGIEQGHGNAIDIGYLATSDETVTPVCTPHEMKLIAYASDWAHYPPGITELVYGFEPPVRALVEDGGKAVLSELDIRYAHIVMPDEQVQKLRVPSVLPPMFPLGNLEIRRLADGGYYNAEIHIGILSPLCYGGVSECDAYVPSRDPNALILPFVLFLSPDTYRQIMSDYQSFPH